MKIVFTTEGVDWDSMMDPRFGRAAYLLIFDTDQNKLSTIDNRKASKEAHGAGPLTAQKIYELHPDILITGNGPGDNALKVLEKANIEIYVNAGEMTVKDAFKAFKDDRLSKI